jgi:GNAT superfamily N-acetyltransferase
LVGNNSQHGILRTNSPSSQAWGWVQLHYSQCPCAILTSSDIPTILAFIQTTASLQDSNLRIEANEDSLLQTLHLSDVTEPSSNRIAHCLLIIAPEGEPAGFAVYFKTYSTWRAQAGLCLEDVFVAAAYRGRGYGRLLMEATAREARRLGCGKLEWMCYRDNEAALRFYDGLGAEKLEELVVMKAAGEKLKRLAGEQWYSQDLISEWGEGDPDAATVLMG